MPDVAIRSFPIVAKGDTIIVNYQLSIVNSVEKFTPKFFHSPLLIVEIRLWKNPTHENFSTSPVENKKNIHKPCGWESLDTTGFAVVFHIRFLYYCFY